jgi:hypothetical protein
MRELQSIISNVKLFLGLSNKGNKTITPPFFYSNNKLMTNLTSLNISRGVNKMNNNFFSTNFSRLYSTSVNNESITLSNNGVTVKRASFQAFPYHLVEQSP